MSGILDLAMVAAAAVAAWTFRAAGAVGVGANPTAALPAGVVQNDLLVIVGVSSANFTNPVGWTPAAWNGTTNSRTSLWFKIAGASESNVTVTNGAAATKVGMLAYTGGAGTLDVESALASATSTTATSNSITTTAPNDLVITVIGDNTSNTTLSNPAGTNTRINSNTTNERSLLVCDEIKVAAGATTARSSTVGASTIWQVGVSSFKV